MANIFAIFPGAFSLDALEALHPADLMRWHARAVARAPKDG